MHYINIVTMTIFITLNIQRYTVDGQLISVLAIGVCTASFLWSCVNLVKEQ